jgi:hypothetical protein
MEVDGFELDTIPRVAPLPLAPLPDVIPLISDKYNRIKIRPEPVVAVPLYELFHMGTGEPHVRTRAELADRFRIPIDATVVASGVNRDAKVEAWWALAARARVMQTLRPLGVALVTTPNFSLFTNVPRPDNLHGIKRIGLSWAELMASGTPAALHINARTDHDYTRWTRFIAERPEVTVLAFEFGTGAGYAGRIEWHVERLSALADLVPRALTLVVRGGVRILPQLKAHFARVLQTDAFTRTFNRRRAIFTEGGRLRWTRALTPEGAPIDDLLAHNVATVRTALTMQAAPIRLRSSFRGPASRRPAQHANRQASFMSELDMSLQTRAVPANRKRMIVAAKA